MGGRGSGPGHPDQTAERRRRALELRLAGLTYAQIGQQLGYSSRAAAYTAVKEAMASQGGLDQARREDELETELARLDALLIALWPKARQGDVAAIDRILKIGERRAALLASATGTAVDQDPESEGTALDEFTRRLRDRAAGT